MTSRVLITDYAWPDLGAETAVLAEAGIVLSARSGETEDDWLAGRAVLPSAA
jgi:hypothetical protein